MVHYNKVNVKLSDSQLNKLKTAIKNQTGVTLRININMFNGSNLPHELINNKTKSKVNKYTWKHFNWYKVVLNSNNSV